MSRENVEALRSAYDGWAVGDMSAGMGLFDADVVYISDDQEPSPGPHYGLDALNRYTRAWVENLNDWSMTALEYRPVESHVLVRVRLSARGRESGMEIAGERFHVFSFRGGRIIRFEVFREERDALEAVGLAE